jgi:hypothetical protein
MAGMTEVLLTDPLVGPQLTVAMKGHVASAMQRYSYDAAARLSNTDTETDRESVAKMLGQSKLAIRTDLHHAGARQSRCLWLPSY